MAADLALPISRWRASATALYSAFVVFLLSSPAWLATFEGNRQEILAGIVTPMQMLVLFIYGSLIAIFGAWLLIWLGRALRGGDLVRLNEDGLAYAGLLRTNLLRWNQLTAFRIGRFRWPNRTLMFTEWRGVSLAMTAAPRSVVDAFIQEANSMRERHSPRD